MSGNPFADLIAPPTTSEGGIELVSTQDIAPVGEAQQDDAPRDYSEWACSVVKVSKLVKHDNADSLSVAFFGDDDREVWDYPVVVRTDTYRVGDRAVYVPVDSILPDEVEFAFLGSDKRRLRAKKLRGVYSEGLLIPWCDVASLAARKVPKEVAEFDDAADAAQQVGEAIRELFPVGADISSVLGIARWVAPTRGTPGRPGIPGSRKAPDESVMPAYRVSNAKKGEGLQHLAPDTRVIVTEKLHGANIRFVLTKEAAGDDGTVSLFTLGSHNTLRDAPDGVGPNQDWFQRTAAIYNLAETLEENEIHGMAFYGEVLGVQDLDYGANPEIPQLRVFDVYALSAERWLPWNDVVELCRAAGLDHVPILYDGPLNECDYRALAEGETNLDGATHVREGVVIRTYAGAAKDEGPRRKWKYVGQGYRTRKGNQTDNQE